MLCWNNPFGGTLTSLAGSGPLTGRVPAARGFPVPYKGLLHMRASHIGRNILVVFNETGNLLVTPQFHPVVNLSAGRNPAATLEDQDTESPESRRMTFS